MAYELMVNVVVLANVKIVLVLVCAEIGLEIIPHFAGFLLKAKLWKSA